MIRMVLTAMLVFPIVASSSAGEPKKGNQSQEKQGPKENDKKHDEAQVKALQEKIRELKQQEAEEVKKIDEQIKAAKSKAVGTDERYKVERDRLEVQEKEALLRIDQRFQREIKEHEDQQRELLKEQKDLEMKVRDEFRAKLEELKRKTPPSRQELDELEKRKNELKRKFAAEIMNLEALIQQLNGEPPAAPGQSTEPRHRRKG